MDGSHARLLRCTVQAFTWTDSGKPQKSWTDSSEPQKSWTDSSKPQKSWKDSSKPQKSWMDSSKAQKSWTDSSKPQKILDGFQQTTKNSGRIPANHKNPQSREYLCTWDLPTTKQECYSFDYDFQFSRTTKNILHMLENR